MENSWSVNGDRVDITIGFQKINRETRTVSGFATLDNVDTHGDVVDAAASEAAFRRFRGNLREMHQPLAVGKVVDFQTQEFTDPKDGSTKYKGVYVTAYVSKGAQDTWEKVLDGTLSGFSIGGVIKQKELGKSGDKTFNIIKEYDLQELSLVDNPANQLANVFSITKMADNTTMATGIAVDTKVKNVLYDREHDVVILSDDESRDGYENAGWVEDNEEAMDKAADVVANYKQKYIAGSLDNKIVAVRDAWYKQFNSNREGDEYVMAVFDGFVVTKAGEDNYRYDFTLEDNITFGTKAEVTVTTQIIEKAAAAESLPGSETSSLEQNEGGANMATETNEETVEEVESVEEVTKAADIDEAPTVEVDVEAIIAKAVEAAVAAVQPQDDADEDAVTKAVTELTSKVEELTTAVGSIDTRVSSVETGTAVRKSADAVDENDDEDEDDSDIWKNAFIGSKGLVG